MSSIRRLQSYFVDYIAEKEKIVYCCGVNNLFYALRYEHNPAEWRLFIDSSKRSLKALLRHIGNFLPVYYCSIFRNTKETYEVMSSTIKSNEYTTFNISRDFKVIRILTGMYQGYTKECCFLCECDSLETNNHYNHK